MEAVEAMVVTDSTISSVCSDASHCGCSGKLLSTSWVSVMDALIAAVIWNGAGVAAVVFAFVMVLFGATALSCKIQKNWRYTTYQKHPDQLIRFRIANGDI